MAKISADDKMRIQTLREQGLGAKAIRSAYAGKSWSLASVKRICQQVDSTGSALGRKPGSGRPKTARTADNIAVVQELICSQDDQPGSSKSVRQIARETGISRASVQRIAKTDLGLTSFKRMPVQVITEATRLKRLSRCKTLLRRFGVQNTKKIFLTDEKIFYVSPPVNSQNNRVWSAGRKSAVDPQRLLVPRAKFSAHVMVSAGVCAMAEREGCILLMTKQRSTRSTMSQDFYPSWQKTATLYCRIALSFNKMALQPTLHTSRSNGWKTTARTSLTRTSGHLTPQISTPWTTMFGEQCLTSFSSCHPSQQTAKV